MGDHCGFPVSPVRSLQTPWLVSAIVPDAPDEEATLPGRSRLRRCGHQWITSEVSGSPFSGALRAAMAAAKVGERAICKVSVRSPARGHFCCSPAVALRPHQARPPSRGRRSPRRSLLARHTGTRLGRIRIACTPGQRRSPPRWRP
jgi:hypothetical protein